MNTKLKTESSLLKLEYASTGTQTELTPLFESNNTRANTPVSTSTYGTTPLLSTPILQRDINWVRCCFITGATIYIFSGLFLLIAGLVLGSQDSCDSQGCAALGVFFFMAIILFFCTWACGCGLWHIRGCF